MSTIAEIKARLAGTGTPFRLVEGATALAQLKDDRPNAMPAAFVLIAKEATDDNERMTGTVLQRSERDVMVVIVTEDLADPLGDAAADALESLKTFVRGKLLGFVPTDMVEPITHVAGEVVEARAGAVWFEDTFSAPIYLKEQD